MSEKVKLERFADPYKRCCQCGAWVDGIDGLATGPLVVLPEPTADDIAWAKDTLSRSPAKEQP